MSEFKVGDRVESVGDIMFFPEILPGSQGTVVNVDAESDGGVNVKFDNYDNGGGDEDNPTVYCYLREIHRVAGSSQTLLTGDRVRTVREIDGWSDVPVGSVGTVVEEATVSGVLNVRLDNYDDEVAVWYGNPRNPDEVEKVTGEDAESSPAATPDTIKFNLGDPVEAAMFSAIIAYRNR